MRIEFIECPNKDRDNIEMDIGIARTFARKEANNRHKLETFDEVMRSFGWIIFLTDIKYFGRQEILKYIDKFNL